MIGVILVAKKRKIDSPIAKEYYRLRRNLLRRKGIEEELLPKIPKRITEASIRKLEKTTKRKTKDIIRLGKIRLNRVKIPSVKIKGGAPKTKPPTRTGYDVTYEKPTENYRDYYDDTPSYADTPYYDKPSGNYTDYYDDIPSVEDLPFENYYYEIGYDETDPLFGKRKGTQYIHDWLERLREKNPALASRVFSDLIDKNILPWAEARYSEAEAKRYVAQAIPTLYDFGLIGDEEVSDFYEAVDEEDVADIIDYSKYYREQEETEE